MFKAIGNLTSLMKQASQMQGKMQEMQENLAQVRVEGAAGGGMVTVEVNGHLKVTSLRIEEALYAGNDREMLEDLLMAATNQALDKAREAAAEEMAKLTGGINIPGLEDALKQFGGTTPQG